VTLHVDTIAKRLVDLGGDEVFPATLSAPARLAMVKEWIARASSAGFIAERIAVAIGRGETAHHIERKLEARESARGRRHGTAI
jgi:hypothetical protein